MILQKFYMESVLIQVVKQLKDLTRSYIWANGFWSMYQNSTPCDDESLKELENSYV